MRVTAALAVSLTVIACSTDDLFDLKGQLGIDDGASDGAKESLKVDGSSEARLELATGATLTLPKGAVDHNVTIGVERPSDTKAIELVETLKSVKAVASAPYVLTPHGTEFAKDVKLEIPIVNNKNKALVVAWLKDESDREWKFLDSPVVEGDVAVVILKHFSVVVLLDRARSGLELDASVDTEEDAGAEPDVEVDAGAELDEPDAATNTERDAGAVADAGTVRVDPGSQTMDAAVQMALDAGSPPATSLDAGSSFDASVAETDSGSGQASDSGSASGDAEPDPDTGMSDAGLDTDGGSSDASRVPDTDAQRPPCEPILCQLEWCGTVDNGCGEPMACGNCEEFGGECGLYEPNHCAMPPPIDV